ncbi:Disease resistance protein [Quillaja saponaria]|uniref:Disease resistance protein n=1 Tax=Quillaja saponaria TaxID=32244 RepID=A0AAD7KN54_QUISA|nr:Disease resistance protein [Quillaja saponaria]
MHDVVRDVAMTIASNLHYAFVVRFDKLNDWPEKYQLRIYTSISLRLSNIGRLPEGMDFPSLEFFCFANNEFSFTIPDNFFEGMSGLKLEDTAMIGELKNLKVLSLLATDIKQLPRAIGQLTQLQLLDLGNCSKLEVIPPNVLSNFKKLEELNMENSFSGWESEEANSEDINANLRELNCLPELNTSDIRIRDPSAMPMDLLFKKLERYKILIGDVWNWFGNYKTSRTLKLKINMSFHLVQGILRLLERVEDLHLDELSSVKNVLYELNQKDFHI